mgnify:CR=1 FL=1
MVMKKVSILTAVAFAVVVTSAVTTATTQDKPAQVLINNVDVWDGTSDKLLLKTDVLVEGNKFKKVGKNLKADGANVIDGKGYTVTPGNCLSSYWV